MSRARKRPAAAKPKQTHGKAASKQRSSRKTLTRTRRRGKRPPAIRTARPIYSERELRSLSIAEQQARSDALTVASYMRTQDFSLARAAREANLTPLAARGWLGPSLRKAGRRWTIKPTDKQVRIMKIITRRGILDVPVYSSAVASKISAYANAVQAALGGDLKALRSYRLKSFRTGGKREFPFITDLAVLKRLHAAGELPEYTIYASV